MTCGGIFQRSTRVCWHQEYMILQFKVVVGLSDALISSCVVESARRQNVSAFSQFFLSDVNKSSRVGVASLDRDVYSLSFSGASEEEPHR